MDSLRVFRTSEKTNFFVKKKPNTNSSNAGQEHQIMPKSQIHFSYKLLILILKSILGIN